jgi:hypothetical protein
MKRFLFTLAALVFGFSMSACDGSSASRQDGYNQFVGRATYNQFVARATTVCVALATQEERLPPPQNFAPQARIITKALISIDTSLKPVETPSPRAERYLASIADEESASAHLSNLNQDASFNVLQKYITEFQKAYLSQLAAAKQLGLPAVCLGMKPKNSSRPSFATNNWTGACPRLMVFAYNHLVVQWQKTLAAGPAVSFIVMNIANGPGILPNQLDERRISEAHRAGIRVLGYVYTDFAERSLASVEQDVRAWTSWYPLDGIFLDNVPYGQNDAAYYEALTRFIRSQPEHFVAMNGSDNSQIAAMADIDLLTEGNFQAFQTSFADPNWLRLFPGRHYGVSVYATNQKQWETLFDLAARDDIGNLSVTSLPGSMAYANLPIYFGQEVKRIDSCKSGSSHPLH